MRQRLIQLPLIKNPLFRLKWPRMDHSDLLAIGPVHRKNSNSARRHPQVKKPGLDRKSRRIRQNLHRKRVFKRLFDFLQSQRTIEIEGRIIPIELHIGSIVYRKPMQCLYIVFTHGTYLCQLFVAFLRLQNKPFRGIGRMAVSAPLLIVLVLVVVLVLESRSSPLVFECGIWQKRTKFFTGKAASVAPECKGGASLQAPICSAQRPSLAVPTIPFRLCRRSHPYC